MDTGKQIFAARLSCQQRDKIFADEYLRRRRLDFRVAVPVKTLVARANAALCLSTGAVFNDESEPAAARAIKFLNESVFNRRGLFGGIHGAF